MARSRKKKPIQGNAVGVSEKADKALAHRAERRAVNARIQEGRALEILPLAREIRDVWDFAKDGKCYRRVDPSGKLLRK